MTTTMTPTRDDLWQLVDQARGGDAEAYGKLYDDTVDMVYRFVVSHVGRRMAEDLTSEVYLRGWRSIASLRYRQAASPVAWLLVIARRLIIDHIRRDRRPGDRVSVFADISELAEAETARETLTTDDTDPAEAYDRYEMSRVLLGAVDALHGQQRDVVLLRFWQGLTVEETAEVLGRTVGATKALQMRACRALRRRLPAAAV